MEPYSSLEMWKRVLTLKSGLPLAMLAYYHINDNKNNDGDDSVWFLQGKVKDIELKGHTDSVDQLCWDPKHGDLIATASGDKTVRLWDARSKLLLYSISISVELV